MIAACEQKLSQHSQQWGLNFNKFRLIFVRKDGTYSGSEFRTVLNQQTLKHFISEVFEDRWNLDEVHNVVVRASLPREAVEVTIHWTNQGAKHFGCCATDRCNVLRRRVVKVSENLADFFDQTRFKQFLEEVLAADWYNHCLWGKGTNRLQQSQS